jgi:hypothetical protein
VIHPHHPLYNHIVKVLRRAGNSAYPEPCYPIELPDGNGAAAFDRTALRLFLALRIDTGIKASE